MATYLEAAWGRLRRALLRRFRPGYVRRMAEKRQGHCPDCPHDIIDSRDLKFCRNVCGYYFGPEDDPIAVAACSRWPAPASPSWSSSAPCCSASPRPVAVLGVLVHWAFFSAPAAALGFWMFVVSFFRDPERTIPTDPDALLSPADGTVTHVGEVERAGLPRRPGLPRQHLPVGVQRPRQPHPAHRPGAWRCRYFPGCFVTPRRAAIATSVNEQFWMDLEEPGGRLLRVKQMAGAIARRIVCWARPNEELKAGERYGMIKFGSRTDVLMPAGEPMEVLVKVGDAVRGGSDGAAAIPQRTVDAAHRAQRSLDLSDVIPCLQTWLVTTLSPRSSGSSAEWSSR